MDDDEVEEIRKKMERLGKLLQSLPEDVGERIERCVTLLQSGDAEENYAACFAFWTLGSRHRAAIAAAGAIEPLVALLRNDAADQRAAAVT